MPLGGLAVLRSFGVCPLGPLQVTVGKALALCLEGLGEGEQAQWKGCC